MSILTSKAWSVCRQEKWHRMGYQAKRGFQVFSSMLENT